jgi:hypothetical protein
MAFNHEGNECPFNDDWIGTFSMDNVAGQEPGNFIQWTGQDPSVDPNPNLNWSAQHDSTWKGKDHVSNDPNLLSWTGQQHDDFDGPQWNETYHVDDFEVWNSGDPRVSSLEALFNSWDYAEIERKRNSAYQSLPTLTSDQSSVSAAIADEIPLSQMPLIESSLDQLPPSNIQRKKRKLDIRPVKPPIPGLSKFRVGQAPTKTADPALDGCVRCQSLHQKVGPLCCSLTD